MTQIVRKIQNNSALALGAVAIWGVFEFVALQRSQLQRRVTRA